MKKIILIIAILIFNTSTSFAGYELENGSLEMTKKELDFERKNNILVGGY